MSKTDCVLTLRAYQAEVVAGLHMEVEGSRLAELRAGGQLQVPADSFQQLISRSKAAEEQVDQLDKQLLEMEREAASR
ncbi:hypothetical protein ABBQ38_012544 [Trebouxia sp. C0009 RCD-2024]